MRCACIEKKEKPAQDMLWIKRKKRKAGRDETIDVVRLYVCKRDNTIPKVT